MAVLSDNDRFAVWRAVMQEFSEARIPISISKTDLRAVINAIDNYANETAPEFNQAIPQPGRSALTAADKARLFRLVIKKRFEVS